MTVEKLATGFQFTEGPIWHPSGFLLFSDIPANKIYRLYPGKEAEVYLDRSGFTGADGSLLSDMIGSNGLAIDSNKNLVLCQHGNHAVSRIDSNGKMHVLTDRFDGRPYNSPNDLVISSDGSIYFTDPPYGLKEQVIHPSIFQTGAGVYRYKDDEVKLLTTDLRYPNGICFSPREEYIYVGSNHPDEPIIWRYTLSKSGEILHQSELIEHNADGIKTNDRGDLFLATDKGILIVSAEGKKLDLISLPETPSNLAWGAAAYKELYVTARSSIYKISQLQ
ncbi:MAG: SMP-30/gluconolactonase/LRE family protein [Chitinophagaceae bacterium]|nr:SMP-30/gluconolactonase/LRE family protein [Chitinophagaceae bacterium]